MGENRLIHFRKERDGSRFWLLVYLYSLLLILFFPAETVYAVDTMANPPGTTIDIFDYYVYKVGTNTQINSYNNSDGTKNDTGINEGHTLWFHTDTSKSPIWNHWTDYSGKATQGIVKPLLGEDGFPVLNCGGTVTQNNTQNPLECTPLDLDDPSLRYLYYYDPEAYDPEHFNDDDLTEKDSIGRDKKVAYPNINEIFTTDEDGNYYFDAQYHRAKMDRTTGTISVDEHESLSDKKYGFYPFSSTGERPTSSSGDVVAGWFFGVHIQSQFSIPYDHMVLNKNGVYQDMVYRFSGDDDVWIYIDGVLIGDVGGIHSREDLNINFRTGEVSIKNHAYPNVVTQVTTIGDMVLKAFNGDQAAAIAYFREHADMEADDWIYDENGKILTFGGSTYHKLDFFYLERGAGGSNMMMDYNLVSTVDFGAHKALHIGNHAEAKLLSENQFLFRLTGTHCPDASDDNKNLEVVMPKTRHDADVIWQSDYNPPDKSLVVDPILGPKTLISGNAAEGNVNFGNADLNGTIETPNSEFANYVGQSFCYIAEELPPVGAVPVEGSYWYNGQEILRNPDGTYTFDGTPISIQYSNPVDFDHLPPTGAVFTGKYQYKGETIEPDINGKYTFDDIIYDNTVFYYKGTVSEEGWINKTFYTDQNFNQRAHNVYLANFTNRYTFPEEVILTANKSYTSGDDQIPLTKNKFRFTLTDITGELPVLIQDDAGNSTNGKVTFNKIIYTLAEHIPPGATVATYTYRITENSGTQGEVIYSDESYYAQVTLTDTSASTDTGSMSAEVNYYRKYEGTEECPDAAVRFPDENGDLGCFERITNDQVIFHNKIRSLTIDKTVTGNLGSRDWPFTFTLKAKDVKNSDILFIKTDSQGNITTGSNRFDRNGDIENEFSLSHGESITFYDNVYGPITITETEYGYSTTYSVDGSTAREGSIVSVVIDKETTTVSYINDLDAAPPTGIRDETVPALAGIAVSGLMLLTLRTGKKRKAHG